ncbi:Thaumatin-like protein 1 [Hibiscus syriacus]|uniref:Thaumatin-like protein 1 n=1 Tax=Hibiscus syriacus TaxID=106335 RepID=A0A6A2ZKS4_HIBSY|nr:Thaumatin-like protein 1 [Hibiscus syriacus]
MLVLEVTRAMMARDNLSFGVPVDGFLVFLKGLPYAPFLMLNYGARTQCVNVNGVFQCQTGDYASGQVPCNGAGGIPRVTLAEFTLAANNGQDFFDISLVNLNAVCPPELQVKGADGGAVGCKSACLAFNQPQYCCTGDFGTPRTCSPTNYSNVFKSQCPQAYSYAYDDTTALASCTGGANYLITFCP